MGRGDHQIKLRGNRIELEEIEAALKQHSKVKDCAAEVQLGASQIDNTLRAYVVSKQDVRITNAELSEFLALKLPNYMVPAVFLLVEALPHLPNGKVNRQKLASLIGAPLSHIDDTLSPETSIQEIVAQIWQQELKIESLQRAR